MSGVSVSTILVLLLIIEKLDPFRARCERGLTDLRQLIE